MDVSKIIKATAIRGRTSTTAPIIKEDYGLYLLIGGLDLPEVYEVDFSNDEHAGTSVTMIGNADGVLIPNQFIKSGKDVFAFYYHVGDGFGRTLYTIRIPNKLRPDRTNEEPTPEEQSTIDQAISALNSAVEQTAQDVIDADESARSASGDADRAERARTGAETAQGKAEDAQESAERAKDDAETSERNASESERNAKEYSETASEKADSIHSMTASAQTLPAGSSASASYDAQTGVMSFGIPKGKDGTDGDDGYSPTADVSKTGKVATITITDKNGTTSAQVEDGTDGTDGIDGISPSVSVTDITGGHKVTVTDESGSKTFDVMDGATGATPNLTIGTVETLEPTESATATITGTPENPVLNLGIPQGEQGEVSLADLNTALADKADIITDTASGAIASFSDGADNLPLKSLIVDINPIQDLSHGDPSPENICPISGWTSVDVEQRGKNFVVTPTSESGTFGWANVPINQSDIIDTINMLPLGTYTLSYTFTLTARNDTSDSSVGGLIFVGNQYIGAANAISWGNATIGVSRSVSVTFTITSNNRGSYTKMYIYGCGINGIGTTGYVSISKFQIEKASTATPYSPYTGRSITIQLGQTVYGGKLDVLSGELTIDRAMRVFDGTESGWQWYEGYKQAYISNALSSAPAKYTDDYHVYWNTNALAPITNANRNTNVGNFATAISGGSGVAFSYSADGNLDGFKAFAQANPIQFCYELATPLEIQLDAHAINSLYGVNNIWADTGDCTAEYRADTKLYIAKKIAEAISALT